MTKSFIIFSGSSSKHLTDEICDHLKCKQGDCDLQTFNDGEIKIKVNDSVRGKIVFVVHSITSTETKSVNDMLVELYLFIRTLKRAAAKKVIVFIPFYGYCRQDRKTEPRVPISASDVAMMLETAGADRIVAMELHCGQIQGFFRDIACDNIYSSCLLADTFVKECSELNDLVVVSPDAGGVTRAKLFKEKLCDWNINSQLAILVKERGINGLINNVSLVGDVSGKDVVIVDDICDTGGTLLKAVEELKLFGANKIYVCITHGIFSGNALENIRNSPIEKMICSDSIPPKDVPDNIKYVSTSYLLSRIINIFMNGGSINELFKSNMYTLQS
jgi:ribose-phosphate pyrophosphokinase